MTTMTAMPVTILPIAATSKEVEEMMEVFKKAFGPDPLMEFTFNRNKTWGFGITWELL
jgi:hypothetical protein